MKLTDTTEYQKDESYEFHKPLLSFTFSTRSEKDNTITEKKITYSYFEELNEWNLFHYVEKECDSRSLVSRRNWRIVHDVHWDKAHNTGADIDVPEAVLERLDEMLGLDVVRISE